MATNICDYKHISLTTSGTVDQKQPRSNPNKPSWLQSSLANNIFGYQHQWLMALLALSHSVNTTSNTCNHTGQSINFSSNINGSFPGMVNTVLRRVGTRLENVPSKARFHFPFSRGSRKGFSAIYMVYLTTNNVKG